jgi:hypothetical protein
MRAREVNLSSQSLVMGCWLTQAVPVLSEQPFSSRTTLAKPRASPRELGFRYQRRKEQRSSSGTRGCGILVELEPWPS